MNIFKCVNMGPDAFSIWCTRTCTLTRPSLKCLPGVSDCPSWINMDRMYCGVVESVSSSSWQGVPLGCYFLTQMFFFLSSSESETFYLFILTSFRIVNVLHKVTRYSTRGLKGVSFVAAEQKLKSVTSVCKLFEIKSH